ncbi:MAG: IS110 family transposase [Deltaproteobacteria bacterium]|nr:IS110 family transposase [Deltaproteobacteria bacterium]
MEHIAIDLGSRESQVCVRSADGALKEEVRVATRPAVLRRYLSQRPPGRVIVETGSEAFWVAEIARESGREVRVVPSALAPSLGVGRRGQKSARKDAAVLSEASCRVELPSVHIPSVESRHLQAKLGMRDALVRSRTLLCNVVHGYLRTTGERVRSGKTETLVKRVRATLGERSEALEPLMRSLEGITASVQAMDEEIEEHAKANAIAHRLQSVPGVGPITALRYVSTMDEVSRFPSAATAASYVGLVPSEHSSGQTERRGRITKAGSPATRAVLVQAAWAALRSKRQTDPMIRWAQRIARRRGRKIAAVALARKLAGILFALWKNGTRYQPQRAAQADDEPLAAKENLLPPRS